MRRLARKSKSRETQANSRQLTANSQAALPTGQTVAVELLPKVPGEYKFACPVGMFRGRLIAE